MTGQRNPSAAPVLPVLQVGAQVRAEDVETPAPDEEEASDADTEHMPGKGENAPSLLKPGSA